MLDSQDDLQGSLDGHNEGKRLLDGHAGGTSGVDSEIKHRRRTRSARAQSTGSGGGIALTWEDVCYSFAPKRSLLACMKKPTPEEERAQKLILNHVSGAVLPGQLLAIMGASGSGKTTLLDVLAGRQKTGTLTGRILVNGQRRDKYYKRQSGYVTQDDCLKERLTVYETFMFYAHLRLPSHLTMAERRERVERVIEELGLEKVRDSKVGGQFVRGISGGERKRVSIGCELITDPSLIFLDEPTTGLDSYNSLGVMDRLSALAGHGRAVVCTIHQPRSTIFHNVDQLMILSRGDVVYFGPAKHAVTYFAGLHFHIRPFINPADFLLDVVIQNQERYERAQKKLQPSSSLLDAESGLSVGPTTTSSTLDFALAKSPAYYIARKPRQFDSDEDDGDDDNKLMNDDGLGDDYSLDMAEAYRSSLLGKAMTTIQEVKDKSERGELAVDESLKQEYASSWLKQFFVLSFRNLRDLGRNPMSTYVLVIQTLFMGLLMGSIYFDLGLDQSSIQNRLGALFFVVTNQSFSMISALNLFLQERDVFNRERAAGVYSTSAYFVAKNLTDFPFQCVMPILFSAVAYWMCGFQATIENFGVYTLTVVTFASVAASLYLFIGTLSPNAVVATILSPVTTVLFLMFGGFYINLDNIPVYYTWLYYVSYFRYAYEVLVTNELEGLKFSCLPSDPACIPTGEVQLQRLGMANIEIWENIGILASMILGYRLLAYVCLRFLYKEKR